MEQNVASERRRIQLLDLRTLKPMDPRWAPLVELWEVVDANARMEKAGIPMRWQVVKDAPMVAGSYKS
jgi:hypothetical protein